MVDAMKRKEKDGEGEGEDKINDSIVSGLELVSVIEDKEELPFEIISLT